MCRFKYELATKWSRILHSDLVAMRPYSQIVVGCSFQKDKRIIALDTMV